MRARETNDYEADYRFFGQQVENGLRRLGRSRAVKALTFQAVGELAFGGVEDPSIVETTDTIVRMTDCGVCGSELHIIQGRESGLDAGTVIGHEFVGEVVHVDQPFRPKAALFGEPRGCTVTAQAPVLAHLTDRAFC